LSIHFYKTDAPFTLGVTMRDERKNEANNMGLHVAKNAQHVIDNRKDVAKQLGLSFDNFVFANQTHSANFYEVTDEDKGCGITSLTTAIPQTDALFTFSPNIVLCTLTADCVPVLFYHKERNVVGAIHSGWRGTVQEITSKTIQHLTSEKNCDPTRFHFYIGPALSMEKFEVDSDVAEQFEQLGYAAPFIHYKTETNKYHIDNQLVVKEQCIRAGVPASQIHLDRTCTFLSEKGFSYREDRKTGRHASFIVREQ